MSRQQGITALRTRLIGELRGRLVADTLSLPLGDVVLLNEIALATADGESDAGSIAGLVMRDPDLAALILRIANSAASAAADPIGEVPMAIARIGLRFVGALALGAPAVRMLESLDSDLAPLAQEVKRHSVWVAVSAAVLGQGEGSPPEMLAAGLVHNIGLGALMVHDPVGARRMLMMTASGIPQLDADEKIFGFNHGKLGAEIAHAWGYPPKLVHMIDQHDQDLPGSPLGRVIRLADLLLRECGIGLEPNEPGAAQQLKSGLLAIGWDRARDTVQDLVMRGSALAEDEGALLPAGADRELLRLVNAIAS